MRLLLFVVALSLTVSTSVRAEQTLLDSRRWATPTVKETLLLGASEALIAVDVLQTLDMNRHRDRYGNHYTEANPLLGAHPGDARILLSGVAGGVVLAASWYVMPPKIRWIGPALVMLIESVVVASNAQIGLTIRL